jgi:hypothetical protein
MAANTTKSHLLIEKMQLARARSRAAYTRDTLKLYEGMTPAQRIEFSALEAEKLKLVLSLMPKPAEASDIEMRDVE